MGVSIQISPQKGPQEKFLRNSADIAIYGGAAGGGKTFALLMEASYHIHNPGYEAVIFRQQAPQITNAGGLWDESFELYPFLGGKPFITPNRQWRFPSGARITFAHMSYEKEKLGWQGSQIPLLMFDELTHFSKSQFFYMLSRNRSTCGVRPYIRASCNPDPDSWVREFIDWWIDRESGYPVQERRGVVRWFYRENDILHWADSKEEICEKFNLKTETARMFPKSVTFVASKLSDNQILVNKDPGYLANLMALGNVEREQLLNGNWKIKPTAGSFFNRTQVGNMIQFVPKDVKTFVRAWDLAATTDKESGDAAYTAGVLMGKRADGRYIVIDVINARQSAADVRSTIRHTAEVDRAKYGSVKIRLPQDPGQAGKDQAQSFIKLLAGYVVKAIPESGSKETRAEPVAAQWQAGNFDIVVGDWNEMYFSQLESFPTSKEMSKNNIDKYIINWYA